MDALFDADLVGVDILQYPVESELSEVKCTVSISDSFAEFWVPGN